MSIYSNIKKKFGKKILKIKFLLLYDVRGLDKKLIDMQDRHQFPQINYPLIFR